MSIPAAVISTTVIPQSPERQIRLGPISLEDAIELLERMSSKIECGDDATRAVKGFHPDHGMIYVVMPAMGESLFLPFGGKPMINTERMSPFAYREF